MENLLSTNGNDFDESGEKAAFREMRLAHEACFAVWYDREMDGWGSQTIEPVGTFIKERDRVLLSMDINSFDVKRALPTIPRGLFIQTTTIGEN